MARGKGASPMLDPQEIVTFEALVQEEQSLKERMQVRLDEITPQVKEAEQIKAWLAAHGNESTTTETSTPAPSAPARQSNGQPKSGTRRGDTREQFLKVVRQHPEGITVANVAKELGKSPAYFYRISSKLKEDGVIADAPNGSGVVAA